MGTTVPRLAVSVLLPLMALVSCAAPGSSQAPASVATSPTRGASASASATTSALPELTAEFTSTQHGYSIKYPADWILRSATMPWAYGSEGATPQATSTDTFRSRTLVGAAGFTVTSQALPPDVTGAQWLEAYLADSPPQHAECWPLPAELEQITIAGQPAGVHGGMPHCSFTEAIAIVSGRAYLLTAYPDLDFPTTLVFDRALFDAFLATVVFRPEDAR